MRSRFTHLAGLVAVLAATSIASGVALAQSGGAGATKFSGVATGSGLITRTITDVVPNGPNVGPFGVVNVMSGSISVSVTSGQTAATVANNYITQANTVLGPGYSGMLTTPGTIQDPTRPKILRQSGSYATSGEGNTVPGISVTFTDPYTVLDAPGLSPLHLGLLVGALPALAFWHRRRRNSI